MLQRYVTGMKVNPANDADLPSIYCCLQIFYNGLQACALLITLKHARTWNRGASDLSHAFLLRTGHPGTKDARTLFLPRKRGSH